MKDYYVMDSLLLNFYDLPDRIIAGKMAKMRGKALQYLPEKPEKVLDVATGTASIAIQIKERHPSTMVYGIDLSEKMLEMASEKIKKKNLNIELSKQNMEKTMFEEGFFDAITIGFAMHHVTPQKTNEVLKEAKRVLRENGKIIIIDVHKPKNFALKALLLSAITLIENHTKPFLKQDMVAELKKAGFGNVRKSTHYFSLVQVIEAQKG